MYENRIRRLRAPERLPPEIVRVRVGCLAAALGLLGVAMLGVALTPGSAASRRDAPVAVAAAEPADRTGFLLNALLVPALDADALPLRWTDPLPALRCAPGSAVQVNREALVPGAAVPDGAFDLTWRAVGCRPFGAYGPRFDGLVNLTVFREEWGWSAMVEPAGLRMTPARGRTVMVGRGAQRMPRADAERLPPAAGGDAAAFTSETNETNRHPG